MEPSTIIAALLCTTAISLLPNILLFLFPNYSSNSPILSIGQALAAGGLLGDVFLHTLPHAMTNTAAAAAPVVVVANVKHNDEEGMHDDGHDFDHISDSDDHVEMIGLAVLAGFLIFFIFDVLVRSFGHEHTLDHEHTIHHDHSHSHITTRNGTNGHINHNDKANTTNGHSHINEKRKSIFSSSTVILNLVADSLHNFTDGIAIGASFAGSAASILSSSTTYTTATIQSSSFYSFINNVFNQIQSRGGLASLAVLFHEIPHELGDFSILMSAGMTKHQAIMTQFTTAFAAFCGTIVGLFGMEKMKLMIGYDLMVPFTAGGFIYLAAVTILPSLLQEKRELSMRILHIMAFILGIVFMYYVAVLEHNSSGHDHGHEYYDQHQHEHGHDHHHSHSHDQIHDMDHHSNSQNHGHPNDHDEF